MKEKHKRLYLEKVILPNMCSRGFGESIIVGKVMVNVGYMTIPDLKRCWRKERRSDNRDCGKVDSDKCDNISSSGDMGSGLDI